MERLVDRERVYTEIQSRYRDGPISAVVSYSQWKRKQQTTLFQFIRESSRIIDTLTHAYTSPEVTFPLNTAHHPLK